SMTNILNSMDVGRPSFDLYINKTKVTNGASFSLKQFRKMQLEVKNVSEITAEGVAIDFYTPLGINPTNLSADGWVFEPQSTLVLNGQLTDIPNGNHWKWLADKPVPYAEFYLAPSFEISTNFPYPVILVEFHIYSSKSKNQVYEVTLTF